MASSSNAPAITATLVGSNQPIIVDRYNRNRRGHERRLNDLESLGYTIPPTNPYEEGEGNLEGPEWIPIESRVAPFHIFRGDIVACATHAPLVPNMPDVSRLERAFSHANLHRVRMRDSLELRGDKVLYDLTIQVLDHHYEPVLGRRLSPFVLNHLLIVLLCNAAMSVYVQLLGLLDLVPGLTALQRASTDSGFMGGVFEIWIGAHLEYDLLHYRNTDRMLAFLTRLINPRVLPHLDVYVALLMAYDSCSIVVNLPPMPPFDHNAHWVFRAVTWDAPIKHEDKGIVMFWTNWDNTRTGFDWRLDGMSLRSCCADEFR